MDGPLSGGRIAVFGGRDERKLAEPVFSALPEGTVIDLVGRVDLQTAFACLRRCSLYVGNDSGLMHMAAAAGIPTLGLFGPSRSEIYAPWGPRCAFVRTVESFDELVSQPGYDHRTTGSLMGSLAVAGVADAAETLWQSSYGEVA
jgi:ADP-heptose:LPS heptosyltransferase